MIDSRGSIPGHTFVPFHIRVEREEVAGGIESDVVGGAKAEAEELPWHVRLHDRSVNHYQVHLAVTERVDESAG